MAWTVAHFGYVRAVTPTRAGARQPAEREGQMGHTGRRPRRCVLCHEVGTPDNPLSQRRKHHACAMAEVRAMQEWGHLFTHRAEPDFRDQVLAFLDRWQGITLPDLPIAA